MATTKISANVLASGAALTNINAGSTIDFTKNVSMSGNLTVDTNTLVVDSVNNRVGIATTTPAATLDVKGNVRMTGIINLGSVQVNGNQNYTWDSRGVMSAPSDGVIKFTNWATTDFNRLQLGGTTSSFPALKRNGAGIDVRLADDSGASTITASNLVYNTGDQTIAGAKTFSNKIQGNATDNSLPNQTLSVSDNTRILTQKTSARDDMWSAWQKRWIIYGNATYTGASFGASGGTMAYSVNAGTASTGRAGSFGETGMTLNPGQGAAWSIPSSFAVGFGFFGLYTNNVLTSNNITNGSNTFVVNTIAQAQVGHRINSSAFPEETYVSAINGTTITATKNAIATPSTPHTVIFSPDQISRVVLGTHNTLTRYCLECPNANENFVTSVGKSVGDTSLQIYSNIAGALVSNMWNGQPYFILTTQNNNISQGDATAFYAACTYFPSGSSAMNVLRCDNQSGTPVTTTGTWDGTVTPTNQIVVASATNIVAGQTVSGLGIPHNTTVSSIVGTTVTLNQTITSSGAGVAVYFGYQRIYVDQNATNTSTGQSCGFILKNTLGQYIYGRGIPSGTTITNITNSSSNLFNLIISNALTKEYATGVYLGTNFTSDTTYTGNNCIFMDYSSDPADGYLKVRLAYMLNGIITYSDWASFPKGNVPSSSYNYMYQAVIDYDAAADKLRLFVDRNGDIVSSGAPRDWPKPPSTPTIEMNGVSALNNKTTNIYFGAHIYGNNVNTLPNTVVATLQLRQMIYYPYQTFID